jgi:hypothetical protein
MTFCFSSFIRLHLRLSFIISFYKGTGTPTLCLYRYFTRVGQWLKSTGWDLGVSISIAAILIEGSLLNTEAIV